MDQLKKKAEYKNNEIATIERNARKLNNDLNEQENAVKEYTEEQEKKAKELQDKQRDKKYLKLILKRVKRKLIK